MLEASGRIYGYRKIRNDLHDMGEPCGKHRVARLMRLAGLRSHTAMDAALVATVAGRRWSRRICSSVSLPDSSEQELGDRHHLLRRKLVTGH